MRKLFILSLVSVLTIACGGEEESNVLKFTNADVYEILLKDDAIDPTWSPDGSKIVYVWENDLWSMTPEGEEDTKLTSLSGREIYPNFSPAAGTNKLVFINNTGPEEYIIYTLTPGGEPEAVETFSNRITSTSFSSDGSYIVFLEYNKKGIFKIPVGGGEVTQIPNNAEWKSVGVAQVSPTGNVVYFSEQVGTDYSLKSISVEGGDAVQLASYAGSGQYPTAVAAAYGGATIAIALQTDIWQRNIFSLLSSGGEITPLTEFPSDSFHPNNPSWSPDGSKIVIEMPTGIYMIELK